MVPAPSFRPSYDNEQDIRHKFSRATAQFDEARTSDQLRHTNVVGNDGMGDTSAMNNISSEVLNAKLEAIESRLDGKVDRIERALEQLASDRLREHQAMQAAFAKSIEEIRGDAAKGLSDLRSDATKNLSDLQQEVRKADESIRKSADETKSANSSLKTNIIFTGVAVVLGIAAFNATVLSNMVASFESGKSTATNLSQTQAQLEKREQRLNEIEKKLDTLISSKPAE